MIEILIIIGKLILLAVVVEALTEILVESEFFFGLRTFLAKSAQNIDQKIEPLKSGSFNNFIDDLNYYFLTLISLPFKFLNALFGCGYCMSVWSSGFFAAFYTQKLLFNIFIIDLIFKVLLFHRLSNIIHELFKRWFDRVPIVIVFNHVKADTETNEEGGIINGDVRESGS